MPDIGFNELLMIAIIGIIVLGPDKFPEAMRGLGRFFYKIKRFWRNLTADIRRELELEEMREEMQRYREELKKLQEQIKRDTTQIDKGLTSLSDLTDVGQGRPFNLK